MSSFSRFLATALVLVSLSAQAELSGPPSQSLADVRHELTGGTNLGVKLTLATGVTGVTIPINLGYAYAVHRNVQIGLLTDFQFVDTGASSVVSWEIMAGPVFNFGGLDLRDDFFIGVGGGLQLISSTGTATSALIGATLGKRFLCHQNVSFSPHLNFKLYTSSTTPEFEFVPVSLSVLW